MVLTKRKVLNLKSEQALFELVQVLYWIIFHELVNYFWIGEYENTYINGENIVNLKASMK